MDTLKWDLLKSQSGFCVVQNQAIPHWLFHVLCLKFKQNYISDPEKDVWDKLKHCPIHIESVSNVYSLKAYSHFTNSSRMQFI